MRRVLVTGANGQIGSELVDALRSRYGTEHVIGLDLHRPPASPGADASGSNAINSNATGPNATDSLGALHEIGNVRDAEGLADIITRHDIGTVYHLASLLSASGEQHPDRTWDVNLGGLKNVLDLARTHDLRVFWPSSIAVFGPQTPRDDTPQETIIDPVTMYGVTKRSGELLCRYYHNRFGVDVRSLRYPGLVSYKTSPGGGTTDYAVDMYLAAVERGAYTCFVRPDTRLPMMYMPDALRATLGLMDADADAITVRTSYNVTGMSFSADELAAAITQYIDGFTCTYEPDERQTIADAWPTSIDDRIARTDWSWSPEYDLARMTRDMLYHLQEASSLEA